MRRILVVGSGFSGSVIARVCAEAGINVHIIEKRSHVGGNAFDSVNENNELIHWYGPHLFHGDVESVAVKWMSRFTEWIPYEHRVRAILPGGKRHTPLPVNATTLEDVYGITIKDEDEAKKFIESKRKLMDIKSADDVFLASVGPELADIFFRPYTQKMWAEPANRIAASVGQRIPVRYNRDDRYFMDSFQALPRYGYERCFLSILDHPRIALSLETEFCPDMKRDYSYCFITAPIDWYYNYKFGVLPYRSIKFEHRKHKLSLPVATMNFTDSSKFTRMTQWSLLPNCPTPATDEFTITYEVPCDPVDNSMERYYPDRNAESMAMLNKYKTYADYNDKDVLFCGRNGLFEYLDMVPAITRHIGLASSFVRDYG